MAVITPDTFDPLRSYISVRLQQGVPLVDADWNEAHDVRKFEVQAFLKWFAVNGVPEGNDGFRIAALDPAVGGDFVIRRGVSAAPEGTSHVEQGLWYVGPCLVDGLDVLIAGDLRFRAQRLHVSQGGAATALATTWGVPTIAVPGEEKQRGVFVERSMPGCLVVDAQGRRFVNESCPYPEFQQAMHAAGAIPAWIVFDAEFRRKYPMGPLLPAEAMPDRRLPLPWRGR